MLTIIIIIILGVIHWSNWLRYYFPDAPNQQTLKGDNVNNMQPQVYPREYQAPPSGHQASMYAPGPPPWETPAYEPAGDVSCLWVPGLHQNPHKILLIPYRLISTNLIDIPIFFLFGYLDIFVAIMSKKVEFWVIISPPFPHSWLRSSGLGF